MRSWSAPIFAFSLLVALACGGGGAPAGTIVEAPPPAAPAGDAGATEGAVAAAPAPAAAAGSDAFDVGTVPEELRDGGTASRVAAVGRFEADAGATAALAWVLRSDPEAAVRERAWRALRARWKKGVGTAAEHEAAAVWAAANGDAAVRVEALAALGELSRDVSAPAAHLADDADRVRAEAAEAVFAIASRTGKRAEAKRLLQDRLAVESAGSLRGKLEGWIGKL